MKMIEKTINAATPPIPKKRRGVRLRCPDDIVKLLAKRINKVLLEPDQNNIDVLRVVSYASTVILKAFEVGQLEERIKTIEERIGIDKRYTN